MLRQAFLVLLTLGVCSGFLQARLGPVGSVDARRGMAAVSSRRAFSAPLGLRMSENTPPKGGKEGENPDVVEISVEELQALANKAGIRVQIGSNQGQERPPQQSRKPVQPPPNNFEPLLKAMEPIFKLPPILQYPILLGIFGAVSAIFLPLFGSSTLGDMTGNKPASEQVAEEAAPAAKKPAFEFKATAPPPEEMNIQRSCDIFPWKYTPTCTDPNIGDKGLLKNLDQYTKPNPKVQQMRAESEARRAAAEAANKEKAAEAEAK